MNETTANRPTDDILLCLYDYRKLGLVFYWKHPKASIENKNTDLWLKSECVAWQQQTNV